MVATRWPALSKAMAICSAVVDFPEPPFSLPSTTTCAAPDCPGLACTSMFDPWRCFQIAGAGGQAKWPDNPPGRPTVRLNHESAHPLTVAATQVRQMTANLGLEQTEVTQLAAQRLRHRRYAGGGLAKIGRCDVRLEITPALKRPHRPRRDCDHLGLHHEAAASNAV